MRLTTAAIIALTASNLWAQDNRLIDAKHSDKVIDIELHALGGISATTQNYAKAIQRTNYIESAPGASLGAGARIDFPLNNLFALSTGLDMLWSHNTSTFTMDPEPTSTSTFYQSSSYLYARLPVMASFRFTLNPSTQWYVDGGCYLATGMWGKERTHIFTTSINQLNQLITEQYSYKRNYFREDDPIIAAHHTFDFGLTIGSGLIVNDKWSLGLSFTYGLKNSAKHTGPLDVRSHNLWYLASIGYRL